MFEALKQRRENAKKLRKLREAFRLMNLTKEVVFRGSKGEQFPVVVNTDYSEERDVYVFSLPTGVNPANVEKHSYIVSQLYGKKFELSEVSNAKNFVLTIYHTDPVRFPQYAYNVEEISPIIRKCKVPILLGKDEKCRYVVVDMMGDNLPHVLIGGSSGSGKSTQLRSVITTLITSKKNIELYLADMKRSEFHLFRRCECVKGYVTRRNELVVMVKTLWAECERRSDLLEAHEVFNIDQLPKECRVPYIVLFIDEFGVLRKDKKLQNIITDIALLGRALGVFMVLSLQRPDADAVDGDIKTNLNIRMAFRVNSKIDSNIILSSTDVDASKITQGGLMWASVGNKYTQIQAPELEKDPAEELLEPFKTAKPIDIVPTNVVEMEPEQQPIELGLLDTLDKNGGKRK